MKLTLVGMGSGGSAGLTAAGQAALQGGRADYRRKSSLQALPEGCTRNRAALYKTDEICALLQRTDCRTVAVAYSGDTGFYSGAAALCRALDAAGLPCTVEPGISSVQLLAAALHRPWQDWQLVSAHGCACDPLTVCTSGKPTFFSYRRKKKSCHALRPAGRRRLWRSDGNGGENLALPSERLVTDTVAVLAKQQFAPLSVLLVEPCPPAARRVPGLPDDAFLRGKTPMTKQEVRAAVLAAGRAPRRHPVGRGRGNRQCQR